MIDLDGGIGGGQLLRSALSLSTVLGVPFRISNIRASRPNPGLAPQHLAGALALSRICSAKARGLEKGSREVSYEPGEVAAGEYSFDIGTAGSAPLVLQALLPALAFARGKAKITVKGGTHVPWSPNAHYFGRVFLPMLARMGVRASLELVKYGWYPKGGGEVALSVEPLGELSPFAPTEQGRLRAVSGISCCSSLPKAIAERQEGAARKALTNALLARGENVCGISIVSEARDALSPGTCITLSAECENAVLGSSALGERGKPAERVGEEAALALALELSAGATADIHLGDQMLMYMALARGHSQIRVRALTEHMRTNIALIEKFTGARFSVRGGEEEGQEISVDGIGLRPR